MDGDTDTATTNAVWCGRIPVIVSLAEADCDGRGPAPEALHIMALRVAYLPLYAPLVKAHLLGARPDDVGAEAWFSWRGIPLKWHFPIGLLHDMLSTTKLPPAAAALSDAATPWHIKLHITAYPVDKLFKSIPTPGLGNDPPRDFFMNALKESDYIRNQSVKKIMSLAKPDQILLWDALQEGVSASTETDASRAGVRLRELHDRFWGVNAKLVGAAGTIGTPGIGDAGAVGSTEGAAAASPASAGATGVGARAVAVRCYAGWDKPYFQELIPPKDATGVETTLLQALRILAPDLVPSEPGPSPEADTITSDAATEHLGQLQIDSAMTDRIKVVSHGVQIPLDTPVAFLGRNFAYPDNFLHLVLITWT
ncbi:autophagy protein Apg5-domain-containing protein [Chytriomyces sp. MP71]|nr:autophagy protein Apg5-domain-containing protein [Chytriomyces sp. MP71]